MPEASEAMLEFAQFEVRPPPEHAVIWELAFDLINTGNAKAVLRTIRLVVDEAHPSETLRLVEAGAPIVLHHYRVQLTPETREVDIRGRVFGAAVEPRSFVPEEVESFLVDISSSKGFFYRCHLVADWYEARRPGALRHTESPSFSVDFAPEPAELLGRVDAPPSFHQHLPHGTILALHEAAVRARLSAERNELLTGIPSGFVASLPPAGNPSAQLLSDLNHLNTVESLADGSVPMRLWLATAHTLLLQRGFSEAALFKDALDALGVNHTKRNPP